MNNTTGYTKVCANCGKTFEAKRTTAVYCSESCRVKAHNVKKQGYTLDIVRYKSGDNPMIQEQMIELSGDIEMKDVFKIIDESSIQLKRLQELNDTYQQHNRELKEKLNQLKIMQSEIKEGEIDKLNLILELPQSVLYNTYLNEEYLNAVNNNDINASERLVHDFAISNDVTIQIKIRMYENEIVKKITEFDKQLRETELNIDAIEKEISEYDERIRQTYQGIRFYQSRISKYDALITGR